MSSIISDLDQKILDAAKNRDFGALERLLKENDNTVLNEQLLIAAMFNQSKEVEELLDQGAHPNAKNATGETPLLFVASNGYINLVQKLIHLGADVNAQTNIKTSILESAATAGQAKIVKLLIESGAKINVIGCADRTELLNAAEYGNAETVQVLLEAGADIHLPQNEWIVHKAASSGRTQTIQILINAGADIHKANCEGQTPLARAVAHDHIETVQFLLQQGADVNAICDGDWNVILQCASHGSVEMLALLLEAGADVNAHSNSLITPLMRAASMEKEKLESVKLLLEKGADVTKVTEAGMSALSYVARTKNVHVAEALIIADTDISTKKKRIQKAKKIALEYEKPEMVAFLQGVLDNFEKYDTIAQGILQGQIEKMSPQDILQMPSKNPELLQKICLIGTLFQLAFDKLPYEKQKLFYAQTYKTTSPENRTFMENELRTLSKQRQG